MIAGAMNPVQHASRVQETPNSHYAMKVGPDHTIADANETTLRRQSCIPST
jgi:hypothetical protein